MENRCILIATLLSAVFFTATAVHADTDIPDGYVRVATSHGVPPEALYSVSLTETSMAPAAIAAVVGKREKDVTLPAVTRPWPWTINVAGKGYRYSTRLEAWQALQVFMKHHSLKRIDVGIAQVNLGWNGRHFSSTWDAFDPYTNLNAAATILRECWDRNPGSWLNAAGCYHHPAGGQPAARYKRVVSRHLAKLGHSTPSLPATNIPEVQTVAALTPNPGFIWTEPGS